MITLIEWVVYIIGYVQVWRRLTYVFVHGLKIGSDPSMDDWGLAGFVALLTSLVWPVIIILWAMHGISKYRGSSFGLFCPPPRIRTAEEKRQHHLEEIAKLEREVGIR